MTLTKQSYGLFISFVFPTQTYYSLRNTNWNKIPEQFIPYKAAGNKLPLHSQSDMRQIIKKGNRIQRKIIPYKKFQTLVTLHSENRTKGARSTEIPTAYLERNREAKLINNYINEKY